MRSMILLALTLAAGTAHAVVPDEAYTHPQKLVVVDGPSRGSNSVVPESNHSIQSSQPKAVIAAIETALDQVRQAQAAPGPR